MTHQLASPAAVSQRIVCGNCQKQLPIRMSNGSEAAAIWVCAKCKLPYVACCVEEQMKSDADLVRLDERYFDVSCQPPISLSRRREVASIVNRVPTHVMTEKRRSNRIAQSIAVPAIELGQAFVPRREPYQIMVANLSKEGIGLVHDSPIESKFLAVQLNPTASHPVQVIVRIAHQRQLDPIYHIIGGEFLHRLGT